MPYDRKATIRRFLTLAAVALGLGGVAPGGAAGPDDECYEAGRDSSRAGDASETVTGAAGSIHASGIGRKPGREA